MAVRCLQTAVSKENGHGARMEDLPHSLVVDNHFTALSFIWCCCTVQFSFSFVSVPKHWFRLHSGVGSLVTLECSLPHERCVDSIDYTIIIWTELSFSWKLVLEVAGLPGKVESVFLAISYSVFGWFPVGYILLYCWL